MLEAEIIKRFASIHFAESKSDLATADRRLVYRIIRYFTITDSCVIGHECAKVIPRKRIMSCNFVLSDILEWLYIESYIDKIDDSYMVAPRVEGSL